MKSRMHGAKAGQEDTSGVQLTWKGWNRAFLSFFSEKQDIGVSESWAMEPERKPKLQYSGHLMLRADSSEKDPVAGEN